MDHSPLQGTLYCNMMYRDVANYVSNCPQCQIAEGHYTGPIILLDSLIANNQLDILCIHFTKMDTSKNNKEDALILIDTFSKFSQVYITPTEKSITVAKIKTDKLFYVYGISGYIHCDKG